MALTFECKAYACEYEDQQLPPLTTAQKAGVYASLGVCVLLVAAISIALAVRRLKLRQRFLDLGSRALPITLSWSNLSCKLVLGKDQPPLHTLRGEFSRFALRLNGGDSSVRILDC
jgi:hypothetical protein